MTKNFTLEGVADSVEFGKDGNQLDASNSHVEFKNNGGTKIEVRGADATHSTSFVTKSQLDNATSGDAGTVWIEYSTLPSISNFTANTAKEIDLTTGTASLLSDYSTIPQNTSWNGSDARTYIIDTTNGLLTPNNVDKQAHVFSIEFEYTDWGSGTNTGVGGYMSLIEYDGTTEQREIRKQFRKANNDSGNGVVTLDFMTNVTSNVNGSGKGWRLKVTSLESDSNATIEIKSIRLQVG